VDIDQLRRLRQLDRDHHLHPFTEHKGLHERGTFIVTDTVSACVVRDEDGRELLDGAAGLWCVNVGYGRKAIADAVYAQMSKLAYYPSFFHSTTEPPILLSAKLARLAPRRLNHALFSSSGTEANETAIKMLRLINKVRKTPKKRKLIARKFSYHGMGLGTASLTTLPKFAEPYDLPIDGFIEVPGYYPYGAGKKDDAAGYARFCIDETARLIKEHGPDTIAALFAEPIQAVGGVLVPPASYLHDLRQLCRDNDILFVADEVITGFGRVGEWFASNVFDLDPDLLTMAKGITSGYLPCAATMLSDELVDVVHAGGLLAHGFTYSSHPTTAAAALANIAIMEEEQLPQRVREDIGPYFQKKLAAQAEHPAVGEVRGQGLLAAIELLEPGGGVPGPAAELGVKVASFVREEGVIVRGIGNKLAFAPPLVISHAEVDRLFSAVSSAIEKHWRHGS
jgi:putrescine---pyruvate transaminase